MKIVLITAVAAICVGTAIFFIAVPKSSSGGGAVQAGIITVDGEKYYYNEEGVQQFGWQEIDGKLYYFDTVTGRAVRGWYTDIDGTSYYFGFDYVAYVGDHTIDGVLYKFSTEGKLLAEEKAADFVWQVINGKYFCKGPDGEFLTGLQIIDGNLYYFNDEGARQDGWQTIDKERYYFDTQTGRSAKGWMTVDGDTYYFGTAGFALTGNQTIDGKEYSFGTDGKYIVPQASGGGTKPVTPKQPEPETKQPDPVVPDETVPTPKGDYKQTQKDGKTYWIDSSGNIFKGLGNVGGALRLCDPSTGEMLTGRQSYNGRWYHFDASNGAALSGWINDTGNSSVRYYYSSGGPALTGLQTIGSSFFAFDNKTGAQLTGLLLAENSKIYYFAGSNGEAVYGWHTIPQQPKQVRLLNSGTDSQASKTYYFSKDDHAALVGLHKIQDTNGGHGWYAFSDMGTQLRGWQMLGGKWYCFDGANGRAITNTWKTHEQENGIVYLGKNGASLTGVQTIDGKVYYFGSNGFRQAGWLTVDGKRYYFNEDTSSDGAALAGQWRESPEGWCYLGADCVAYTGPRKVEEDNALYLFAANGVRQTGWKTHGSKLYFLDENGKAQYGKQNNGDKHYYIGGEGFALGGVQKISDEEIYYFDPVSFVRKGGWVNVNDKKFYFGGADQAAYINREEIIDGNFYVFGSDGAVKTGMLEKTENGKKYYYYHDAHGIRRTGWQVYQGGHYYFNAQTYRAENGWFMDGTTGGLYYLDPEAKGKAHTGSQIVNGVTYNFDERGKLKSDINGKWTEIEDKIYYVDNDGNYATGISFIEGAWYLLDEAGVRQSGLHTIENKIYYFDPENEDKASIGYKEVPDAGRYYFSPDASAYRGIIKTDDGIYCLNETTCEIMTGEISRDGFLYYFDSETGKAKTGKYNNKYYDENTGAAVTGMRKLSDGKWYLFDDSGVRQSGWHQDEAGRWMCFNGEDNSAITVEYTYTDENESTVTSFFNEDGSAKNGLAQIAENGSYYYFDNKGVKQTGLKIIDGKYYYFANAEDEKEYGQAYAGGLHEIDGAKYYFYEEGEPFAYIGGPHIIGTTTYYFDNEGRMISEEAIDDFEWKELPEAGSGVWYYTDSQGNPAFTGHAEVNGYYYFFNENGSLYQGWHNSNYIAEEEPDDSENAEDEAGENSGEGEAVKKRYYGKQQRSSYIDFRMQTGWFADGDDIYYLDQKDGYAVTGMQLINGQEYTFDENGVLVNSDETELPSHYNTWQNEDGKGTVYYNSSGVRVNGLTRIDGKWYFFAGEKMEQGETEENEADSADEEAGEEADEPTYGYLQHGWHSIDGNWYFFGLEDEAGAYAYTGWRQAPEKSAENLLEAGQKWFRFHDTEGYQLVGWQYRYHEEDSLTYTYYYDKDGNIPPEGEHDINGTMRYFLADGRMAVGEIIINEGENAGEYYFFQNGERATGVVKVNNELRSYDENGRRATGWNVDKNGRRYYFNSENEVQKGWSRLEENGPWYSFHETDAYQRTGWQYRKEGDKTYTFYYYPDGTLPAAEEITAINGAERYFFADGHMATGWELMNGSLYYYSNTGEIAKGETAIKGIVYNFNDDGSLAPGWNNTEKGRYYYDVNGAATGWQLINENETEKYYFFDEITGIQKTGWIKRNAGGGKTTLHYFNEDGAVPPATWFEDVNGADKYYVLADGSIATGWHEIESEKYYFYPENGKMVYGKALRIDGKLYSFGADGKLILGWNIDEQGRRYYFTENGPLLGWSKCPDDGKTYYFNEKEGFQLTGLQTRNVSGKKLYYFYFENGSAMEQGWNTSWENTKRYVLADGQLANGWQNISGERYYFPQEELGVHATGWREISSLWYRFDSEGRQLKGWQPRKTNSGVIVNYYYFANGNQPKAGWNHEIEGESRYVLKSGEMASGWHNIDSYRYYFNDYGVPFKGKQTINGHEYIFDEQGRFVTPPVIKSVKYDTGGQDPKNVTINATASALLKNKTLEYSFNNGKTWQKSATAKIAAGTVIKAGTLQVRDSAGNISSYGTKITLPEKAKQGTLHGIDVSAHQGYINWAQVAASGQVDFAIIRSLCWDRNKGYYAIDPYFDYNVRTAKAYGINVGTYLYSYAFSESEMREEIEYFMNSAEIKNLMRDGIYFDLPVYIDYEDPLIAENTGHLGIGARTNIVRYGMNLIDQYSRSMYGRLMKAGFYTYYHFAQNVIDGSALQREGYEFWLARYNSAHGWSPAPPIWQYSSSARIPGISTNVDVNYLYKDYGLTGKSSASGSAPAAPAASGAHYLTVKNQYGQTVTEPANEILAKIVAYEVKGFQNAEVYKAQVVAAQSWILYNQSKGVAAPQVGLGTPDSTIYAAVNQVYKETLYYNGNRALTPYYAYNNGKTNDAKYWNSGNNMPYLVSVDSPYDKKAKGSYSQSIPRETLRQRLIAVYGYDITEGYAPENWIQITGRNKGGYVTSLNVCGRTPGTEYFYLTILPYTSGGKKIYPVGSPDFTVSYDGGNFIFTTSGYGHCIGMSQTGAFGMAQQGKSYKEILSHYFPGTKLGNV